VGIDVEGLLRGAAHMDTRCSPPRSNAIRRIFTPRCIICSRDTARKKSIAVMMPYAQALRDLADGFASSGPKALASATVWTARGVRGQTPVKALGATDQHSQIQLYVEGPNDKVITARADRALARALRIPRRVARRRLAGYFPGRDMGN
jgi:glucose-6-phosphate isomerase